MEPVRLKAKEPLHISFSYYNITSVFYNLFGQANNSETTTQVSGNQTTNVCTDGNETVYKHLCPCLLK